MTRTVMVREGSNKKFSLWVRLFPIIFFIFYLNFTVFLFAFGPWPWQIDNEVKLYTFLAFAHTALLLGYLSAVSRAPAGYRGKWEVKRLVTYSIIANLVLLIPTSLARTGSGIPDIASGLDDPGMSYVSSLDMRDEGSSFIEYLRIIVGPLIYLAMPLSVYYWRRLNTVIKWFAVVSMAGLVAVFIAMGTNKAIADTVILIPWLLLAGQLSGNLRISRTGVVTAVCGSIVAFILFFILFTAGQATRPGSGSAYGYFPAAGISADYNNVLIRNLSPEAAIGVTALDGYLTSGYYALSLSMEKPFTPMFGAGNSPFLTRNIAKLMNDDEFIERSYPAKIDREDGWGMYLLWHSIYPWIASDVSFPGTIIVVFFIGRIFALSWIDSLQGDNPFAVAAFVQLLTMLFYFPGNNQCLQSGEAFTSFWVLMALWAHNRTSAA